MADLRIPRAGRGYAGNSSLERFNAIGKLTNDGNVICIESRLCPAIAGCGSSEQECPPPGAHAHEATRVCDKLRIALTRFAGSDGFMSLARRALALASADFPSLETVKLKPDGSLEGLEALAVDATNGGPEAAVAVIAHLLGLLVTFIGEPLTLRLVRDAWPNGSLNK